MRTIPLETLRDLHGLYESLPKAEELAIRVREMAQDALEGIQRIRPFLADCRVIVGVPCTDCGESVLVIVRVGDLTLPVADLCEAHRTARARRAGLT